MLDAIKIILPVVLIALGLLYFFQDALIFFPQPTPAESHARFQSHAYRVEHDGLTLEGWLVRGTVTPDRPLLVYYGGNAEEVSANLWDIERYAAGAYLFMNYRGYGGSGGRPSQKALCRDALHILDQVTARESIPLDRIVLMGRSLGSGVAVHVAANRPVRGVVLVTPFDSLTNVARHHYPIFPVRLLLKHPFNSLALAPGIKTSALMLIAERDEVIPTELAVNLSRAWGGPVRTLVIPAAGHNDIQSDSRYWEAINAFLAAPPRGAS
jgi:pimeloyl-ACP methyl ester carboxylesterase